MRSILALTALCGLASAHFEIVYPKPIASEEKNEGTGPCGGVVPDLTKDLVDFHVDGEAIALKLTHPQSSWLFRATTDATAQSGWEEIYPIVQQSGLGAYCNPQVKIPSSWVGKKGVVSVVSKAVDGLLFQCIAANFVKGSEAPPDSCKNASSVQISFTSDAELTGLLGGSKTSGNNGTSSTGTTPAASTTGSKSAAAGLKAWPMVGSTTGTVIGSAFFALVGAVVIL